MPGLTAPLRSGWVPIQGSERPHRSSAILGHLGRIHGGLGNLDSVPLLAVILQHTSLRCLEFYIPLWKMFHLEKPQIYRKAAETGQRTPACVCPSPGSVTCQRLPRTLSLFQQILRKPSATSVSGDVRHHDTLPSTPSARVPSERGPAPP